MNEIKRYELRLISNLLIIMAGVRDRADIIAGFLNEAKIFIFKFFSLLIIYKEIRKEIIYERLVLMGAPSAPNVSLLIRIKLKTTLTIAPIMSDVTAPFILPVPSKTVFTHIKNE